jgi:hypothetical protein
MNTELFQIQMEAHFLLNFVEMMETVATQYIETLELEYTEAIKGSDDYPSIGGFLDNVHAENLFYVDNQADIQSQYATLSVLYGTFESLLKKICRFCYDNGLSQKEPRKKIYIKDGVEYLVKLVKLWSETDEDAPLISEVWKSMDKVRSVRNAIVHNNGYIDDLKETEEFIKKHKGIKLYPDQQIELSAEFNRLDRVKKYL